MKTKFIALIVALLLVAGSSAALAASIFHYETYSVMEVKEYLEERDVPVRMPGDW